MKPIRIKILLSVFVILLGINANAENPISVTTDWGSIAACGADYVDYMNRTWIINLGVQKPVEFEINIDLEYGCDYLNVYAIDNNNTEHYIGTYTGCESGLIVNSVIPSGKAKVVLITDGSVCNDNGYWGVESYCYIDNSYNVTTSQNSAVNQNLFVSGNSYFQGKVGIGTYFPETKLDVNGSIQAGTTCKIKLMDFPGHASWIDIPAVTGKASGIGSGGAGQNAWIGYAGKASNWFTNSIAGDICYRNTSGKLLFGNTGGNAAMAISGNKIGIGTTTPQAALDINESNSGGSGNGTTANHGILVGATGTGGTLNIGVDASGSFYSWIQSRNKNSATFYNLGLNPYGGNVGIGTGTTAPSEKLTVAGGHSDTKLRLYSTGDGGSQPANLSLWASEPGWTYTGTGIGYNVNGSPHYGRIDQARGSSYVRFLPGETKFQFQNASGVDIDAMTIADNGSVGIGAGPTEKLDVRGNVYINSGIDDNHIYWGSHNMTMGTKPGDYSHNVLTLKPGGASNGKLISVFNMWNANSTTDFEQKVQIHTDGISYFNGGKVGIGISNITTDALLSVNGIIQAREVRVDLTGLADFVFDDNYKLMPLHQVESYVKINNHLPEMPSAAEVSKNGLSMGEMQNKLLQKVEELTLYMIEQQKTINQQSAKIEQLEKKIK